MPSRLLDKYFIFSIVLLLSACQNNQGQTDQTISLPYYDDASFTPHWNVDFSAADSEFHKIPSFELTNQDGNVVSEKTVDGKIYVADFFFASCTGICPTMTSNMTMVQEAFLDDDNVLLLSHSVTPAADSVAILKAYAEAKGVISNKWHLLTGDRSEIYDLGRRKYFVEDDLGEKRTDDEFLHTENFVLIDSNRHIRGIYNGLRKASVNQLIKDIRTLQSEKS